jgi:hypothetical protein
MDLQQFSKITKLSQSRIGNWLEAGLLESAGGEFDDAQITRARLIMELQRKGVRLPQLAARTFPRERFVIFDGQKLEGFADAAAALGFLTRSRRHCAVVDLKSGQWA